MFQRTLAGLVLTLTCAAQTGEIAPEVRLLSRIKTRMAEQLENLPNFTCLETVARFHAPRDRPFKPHDVVRLEIVYSDQKEWFAAPGDATFNSTQPSSFTGSGLMTNGSFALVLHNVFVADATTISWVGEDATVGGRAVRYDFRIPSQFKPLSITVHEGSGTAGEAGSFWVDRDTLDLLALEVRAEDIDPLLPVAESSTRVAFAHTRIGDRDALLAQSADVQLLRTNGELDFDRTEYTHCRAFQARSTLHFGSASDSETDAPARPPAAVTGVVPPFLPVTVVLTTPISSRDTVGSVIEGRAEAEMVHKGKIVVPRGSVLRGRIRRLEHYDADTFAVALEFTEVEVDGVPVRFFADFTGIDPRAGIRRNISEKISVPVGATTGVVTLPPLYGVASFFVTGKSFTLPAGFKTMWRTRGLLR